MMVSQTFAEHRQLQLLKLPPPSHIMVNQPEYYMGLHVLLYGVMCQKAIPLDGKNSGCEEIKCLANNKRSNP
jgi:hypothetical protein